MVLATERASASSAFGVTSICRHARFVPPSPARNAHRAVGFKACILWEANRFPLAFAVQAERGKSVPSWPFGSRLSHEPQPPTRCRCSPAAKSSALAVRFRSNTAQEVRVANSRHCVGATPIGPVRTKFRMASKCRSTPSAGPSGRG
jgi:hypothetical protein